MDPRDFLIVAASLQSSPQEAERRTAVSRAYYALYLAAHEMLEAERLPLTRTGKDHGLVPEYLRDSGNPGALNVADALRDLFSDRIHADYRMRVARFNQMTCALIVTKARVHLATVDRWDAAARSAIGAKIRAARGIP